jgi:uncharacterized membrane protein YdbT with pleckstrin-like domain
MRQEDFHAMIRSHPETLIEFETVTRSYEIASDKDFEWLRTDETLHLVLQKHRMVLVFSMIIPILILLFGMIGAVLGQASGVAFFMWLGASVAVVGLVWGTWNYIDWGNDYYVVTDKRVIWDEEILFLYESIQEASLIDVRSIDVTSSIMQQIFRYGDIIIRTYTGSIEMRDVGEPELIKNFIDEYWKRALAHSKDDERDEIDRRLRTKLGLPVRQKRRDIPGIDGADVNGKPDAEKESNKPSFFADFFKVRYEDGDIITYRKHWFVLLTQTWRPTGAILLISLLGLYLLINFPNGQLLLVMLLFLFGFFIWWGYGYWDWRDDKYQLTSRSITDLERTPLGRETKKSAPLESILSIEHQRLGILGILFNFGSVTINVGDTTFNFDGVHNPAMVRQEISDRQQRRRKVVEAERSKGEEERMMTWLQRYHENARELWELEDFDGEMEEEDDYRL